MIFSVIKYEGPNDVLVWKHPAEDFNTKSQLIVNESQEAIFFKNGQALDTFLAGRYTLTTQNIPLLRKLIGLATGGTSPFHCQVYFINKAVSMDIRWATPLPVKMMDPVYTGIPISIRANGDYSLRVTDGRKLLIKLVGNDARFTQDTVKQYFNGILSMHLHDSISNTMTARGISGAMAETQMVILAQGMKERLAPFFAEYGMEIMHFALSGIGVDGLEELHDITKTNTLGNVRDQGQIERERRRMALDAERIQMEASAKAAAALSQGMAEADVLRAKGLSEAEIMRAKGITEAQRQALKVGEVLAANKGPEVTMMNTPGMANPTGNGYMMAGMGGMMTGMVNSPAGQAAEIVKAVLNAEPAGTPPAVDPMDEVKRKLKQLKELLDLELISEADFEERKKKLMDSLGF